MAYTHLFFDLDHTIWDFEANAKETLEEIFEEKNLKAKGIDSFDLFFEKYSFHNARLWDLYAQGRIKQDVLKWKRMYLAMLDFKIADEKLAKEMDKTFLQILPTKSKLFPYTIEALEYLQEKKYHISLITNGFDTVQAGKLKSSHLGPYFEEVITSERSNSLKPQPEIFKFALDLTHAHVENSIMIGDNPKADIQGAENVGMDTIWVNHTQIKNEIQPTYEIQSLKQLFDIF